MAKKKSKAKKVSYLSSISAYSILIGLLLALLILAIIFLKHNLNAPAPAGY
ncbi:MAG: hypothetical protein AAB521_03065 [Patescibacteria group bacterium]